MCCSSGRFHFPAVLLHFPCVHPFGCQSPSPCPVFIEKQRLFSFSMLLGFLDGSLPLDFLIFESAPPQAPPCLRFSPVFFRGPTSFFLRSFCCSILFALRGWVLRGGFETSWGPFLVSFPLFCAAKGLSPSFLLALFGHPSLTRLFFAGDLEFYPPQHPGFSIQLVVVFDRAGLPPP